MHRPFDRSLCTLAILGHEVLLSERRPDCETGRSGLLIEEIETGLDLETQTNALTGRNP